MGDSREKPKLRINPLLLDDDEFRIVREPAAPRESETIEPRVMPDWVLRAAEDTTLPDPNEGEEPLEAAPWPMLNGVFGFPFRPSTLASLTVTSIGLMATGWLFMLWIAYGAAMGMTSARLIGLPALAAGTLTLGFAFTCCMTIIEETSYGVEDIRIAVGFEWKEWVWNLFHITALGLQAGLAGFIVRLGFSDSWWPAAGATFAAFPLVLLGALAADNAWAPIAIGTVLRSLSRIWWAWVLFYLETGLMAVGWVWLVQAGLVGESPWMTPVYAAPLLAAIILLYARLIGRLARCIAASEDTTDKGDDRDERE